MKAGLGLHDDSFAHSTLDGAANGGVETGWFFWPSVERSGYSSFWRSSVMGGELRPELQSNIFSDDYPANTQYHQDFDLCVNVTHATYLLVNHAFKGNRGYNAEDLERAKVGSAAMGYSFQVTQVEVAESVAGKHLVDVSVTVSQMGVAPFYYPLGLTLSCAEMTQRELPGVDTIVAEGDSRQFSFADIPASAECLGEVRVGLMSSHAFALNPVRFAQGDDGTTVLVTLPLPPTSAPSEASSAAPSSSSSSTPSSSPSSTASSSPSSTVPECTENKDDIFFLKKNKNKTCFWLANSKQKNTICSKKVNYGPDHGPAQAVCLATCVSCDSCYENKKSKFYFGKIDGTPVYKRCKALAAIKNKNRIIKFCSSKNKTHKGYGPPKAVCPTTCSVGSC
mmetsp:Transcript_28051/g.56197  ORF Transcript_28051/g.56197 Transcript_28051/m.56197 type:complete len:394 (-) Transcript_28051:517-1698(-)